ncbi:Chloroperoxidase [Cercophora newfieldiana]|uniref:Chloroperoxidase n=1 Tax=Cercophora newfieldiana TaxID=92897 RepID=A0AA40CIT8_9PEZI|nr:Chloroperoxidase [Cercophora newfieldiana]
MSSTVPQGAYLPPTPTDIRGPCPMLNTLANHGYLPRDGRNIQARDITTALHDFAGVSSFVNYLFAYPIFLVQRPDMETTATNNNKASIWATTLHYLRHPVALFTRFGMRRPSQTHPTTKSRCLNLDQLAFHHSIEHDISLTRRDRAQGDCCSPQRDLIAALLASSSDGGVTLTAKDLAGVRTRRIDQQREENPRAKYGPMQHSFACMEIALLLCVFGDGKSVRCDFVRAFFAEERLPLAEGWVARKGWWRRLGMVELGVTAGRVRKLVGKVEF